MIKMESNMKNPGLVLIFFVTLLTLSACSETAIKTTAQELRNGMSFVSTSAANNMSVTSPENAERQKVCVRLGPDATFSENNSINLSFGGDREEVGNGENENEMVGRSLGIIALRDVVYNLCLANMNGTLTNAQYSEFLKMVIDRGFEIVEIEAAKEQITILESNAAGSAPMGGAKKSNAVELNATKHIGCNKGDLTAAMFAKWRKFSGPRGEIKPGVSYDCSEMTKWEDPEEVSAD